MYQAKIQIFTKFIKQRSRFWRSLSSLSPRRWDCFPVGGVSTLGESHPWGSLICIYIYIYYIYYILYIIYYILYIIYYILYIIYYVSKDELAEESSGTRERARTRARILPPRASQDRLRARAEAPRTSQHRLRERVEVFERASRSLQVRRLWISTGAG